MRREPEEIVAAFSGEFLPKNSISCKMQCVVNHDLMPLSVAFARGWMRIEESMSKQQTPSLPPGSPDEPQPFGKYHLMGLIARGGMAEVYRARPRSSTDRLMAIKCMRPDLAKESRFIEMFIREGKLAVLLDHKNIVRTVEIGRIEGRYFIAMEYISGKDLTQVLRKCQEVGQRIPVPHAVYITSKICDGLHHAHRLTDASGRPLNIVNRDVSPSNVRVSYEGDVKLLDFGIAQAMLKFTSEIGVLKGKFSYMSPEQIRGMPLDFRTDVFSTGIILHEMLTTEKLFRGDSEFDLMEKVRKADVSPPSKFNRRVPKELDAIVLRALAREPADRYQSAQEFADALREALDRYQFRTDELRDFLRGFFKDDYHEERQLMAACLHAAVDEAVDEVDVEELDPVPDDPPSPKPPVEAPLLSPSVEEEPAARASGMERWLIPVLLSAAVAIVLTAVLLVILRK